MKRPSTFHLKWVLCIVVGMLVVSLVFDSAYGQPT